jgi:hypothetical protein
MRRIYFEQIPLKEVLKRVGEGTSVSNGYRRTSTLRRCRPGFLHIRDTKQDFMMAAKQGSPMRPR